MNLNEVPVEMRPLYNLIFNALLPVLIVGGIIFILVIIVYWRIYKKAGKPGWASIVPIYNTIVLLEIAGLPLWYIALMFIPFANIYATIKMYIELAHKFGKSTGFGVLMVFFPVICFPILAFSKNAVYDNGIIETLNTMNQNVAATPVETPIQPQVATENVIPVQTEQLLTPQPVSNIQNINQAPTQNIPQENIVFGQQTNQIQNNNQNGGMM